jgi:Cu(I)/Ag(I) efflux system membrane fusion protein/cobalt-zinc-cadmium efflux system membrane fusion protein
MKTISYFSALIILLGLLTIRVYSQGHDHSHSNDKNVHKKNGMTEKMENKNEHVDKNPLIRKGIIDLKSIDKNKDGKVYQDQMDWNVISDEPGKCPICKMELKQVTLKKAKENLIKNGFKVK